METVNTSTVSFFYLEECSINVCLNIWTALKIQMTFEVPKTRDKQIRDTRAAPARRLTPPQQMIITRTLFLIKIARECLAAIVTVLPGKGDLDCSYK